MHLHADLATRYELFGLPVSNSGYERLNYTIRRVRTGLKPNQRTDLALCRNINKALEEQNLGFSKAHDFFAEFAAGKLNCEMACFVFQAVASAVRKIPFAFLSLCGTQEHHIVIKPQELGSENYWEATLRDAPIRPKSEYAIKFHTQTEHNPTQAVFINDSLVLGRLEELDERRAFKLLDDLIRLEAPYPNPCLLTLKRINLLQKAFDAINQSKSDMQGKPFIKLLKLAKLILELYKRLPKIFQDTVEAKANMDYFQEICKTKPLLLH